MDSKTPELCLKKVRLCQQVNTNSKGKKQVMRAERVEDQIACLKCLKDLFKY